MKRQSLHKSTAFALAFGILAGCGGGGGGGDTAASIGGSGGTGGGGNGPGTSAPAGATNVTEGVMTKGSIIVNGITFSDAAIALRSYGFPSVTTNNLQNGMMVKLAGKISTSTTGVAQMARIQAEVRGPVQSVSANAQPPFFTVNGQKVIVSDTTVFNDLPGSTLVDRLNGLAVSNAVEVHGQRDASNAIRASRVERFPGASPADELRGTVTLLTATTFVLNGITVRYTALLVEPAGSILTNGALVEVHGTFSGGQFQAQRINHEDSSDSDFKSSSDGNWEVEGYINGFTAHPGTFTVNGRNVTTSASTRFEGGNALNLANSVKIEAEGKLVGSTIVAEKISFRETRIIVEGVASAVNVALRTVTVLGKTVRVDDLTEIKPGPTLSSIPVNTRVEVRGTLQSDGIIRAERLEDRGNSGGSKDTIQAQVTAENGFTLTVLGINADAGSASSYQSLSGGSLTRSQFFEAVTPSQSGGTLVKLKGSFNGTALNVEEAELED
ncbi:MAG: DUF5666 domain-containing protein [Burkholderiales bacterium]